MCKELITDERLTPTMRRTRSGRTQVFTEGDINIELEHDKKEMYAELIEGNWYWVSGCAECNGRERNWTTYIECEAHDRCRTCGVNRKDVESTVWGGKSGWTCNSCKEAEDLERKRKAFEALNGEEPDCTYRDEIICAHCGSEIDSSDLYESQEIECDVCGGVMQLEVEYTASYSTEIKGERIIL